MVLEPGRPARVERDVAIDCLEFVVSLLDGTIATTSGDGGTAIAEFAGAGSGMLFTGVWEVPTMKAAGIPLDATTVPTLFGTPAAFADSHAFVLPRQAKPDDDARRDVYKFVAGMLKGSLEWAVPLVVVALGLAALVNLGLPAQWLWRLSFFSPFLLASTVVSMFFSWMYNPQLGLFNDLLVKIGLPPVAWLNDPAVAMWAIVLATVW